MNKIVIIGTGLAGYMLAQELRKLDSNIHLTLITANDGAFYSKPLLSTSLTANREIHQIATSDAAVMANKLNADIRVATLVTRIDTSQKKIETNSGIFDYTKLVLAVGSKVIPVPLLGDAANEILSVNDLEDYARFRECIVEKKSIGILGAGLVGCEFANDLVNADFEVHVIDPSLYPLQRLLPEKVGRLFEKILKENGLYWHLGQLVSEINKINRGYELVLSHQQKLKVDVVMSAIGLQPNVHLAQISGVRTNYGISVDSFLQTNVQDIYALGDCAEVNGQVLCFIAPLSHCARALAKTLLGDLTHVVYPVMPVVLKTPSCPIVIVSPHRDSIGNWHVEGEGTDLKALYYDTEMKLSGFVLTGKRTRERADLIMQVHHL